MRKEEFTGKPFMIALVCLPGRGDIRPWTLPTTGVIIMS